MASRVVGLLAQASSNGTAAAALRSPALLRFARAFAAEPAPAASHGVDAGYVSQVRRHTPS